MTFIQALENQAVTLAAICGLVGLIVGSFLNVVIHRLPKMLERGWDGQAAELLEQKNLPDVAKKLRASSVTTSTRERCA